MDFLAVLVTFAHANWDSKVKFLFELFDFNSSGGISKDELVILGGCWVRGLSCANQTSTPTMAQLRPILTTMVIEADTFPDNHIMVDDLIRWVGQC